LRYTSLTGRHQSGYIFSSHGAWFVRYRIDGKQVCRRLADYGDRYRTERSVRHLAEELLKPLNNGQQSSDTTLQQYIETVYFPSIKTKLKPSTYKGYFNLYTKHIQGRIGGMRLATFTTADGQRLLYKIDDTEQLSHQSLLNINSLLSAFFTHARRSGTLQGSNPMDRVEIPRGHRTERTQKYTLAEVETITAAVTGTQRCAVVVAAWTGLSLAELRGLKWVDIDFDRQLLNVNQTVWHREIVETKTEHRKASVHLLPNVITELKAHHERNPGTAWVFEGPKVFPYDLATLGSKHIKPALIGTGVGWHGFHAFRRGLGKRLHKNGVHLETIGRILRHGSGSEVTLKHYVEVDEDTTADALKNLPRRADGTE
jgi:integrase